MTHRPRVIVVGGVNVDHVVRAPRLPAPGQTVTGGDLVRVPGGKGANQAVAAARLGARASLVAAVGDDELAAVALAGLLSSGVDLEAVRRVAGAATGAALIVVDERGENQITVAPGANDAVRPDHVSLPEHDAVLCPLEASDATLIEVARQARGLLVINTAPARPLPPEVVAHADVLVANEGERAAMSDQLDHYAGLLVVTLGPRGAVALRGGREEASSSAPTVDTVDTVGAGDAFCASLTVDLARGLDVPTALRRACAAGAVATTRPGAQEAMPDRGEVDELLARGWS